MPLPSPFLRHDAAAQPAPAAPLPSASDAPPAAAQPAPLAANVVAGSGPAAAAAPTPNLVMSDQNLQWILSSAANGQLTPQQAVSEKRVRRASY